MFYVNQNTCQSSEHFGGGYVKRGLADHSLAWMVDKANEYGLPIQLTAIDGDTAKHISEFNDSAVWYQTVWGIFTKKREVLFGDVFHWSVASERALVANGVPALPDGETIAYTLKPNDEVVLV